MGVGEKMPQAVAQLQPILRYVPWGHHALLLEKVKHEPVRVPFGELFQSAEFPPTIQLTQNAETRVPGVSSASADFVLLDMLDNERQFCDERPRE